MHSKELTSDFFLDLTNKINIGLLVLDDQYQIVYKNEWLSQHCPSLALLEEEKSSNFFDIFSELKNSRIEESIRSALADQLPSIISNLFNPRLLPIFAIERKIKGTVQLSNERVHQEIQISPLSAKASDKQYCVISIRDISAAVL